MYIEYIEIIVMVSVNKINNLPEQLSEILGPDEDANNKIINFLKMSDLYKLI